MLRSIKHVGLAALLLLAVVVLLDARFAMPAEIGIMARSHGHGSGINGETMASVSAEDLPAEARTTLSLIKQGGPYPYPRDGIIFGNREGRLPSRPRGYYREYTVKTPGRHDRGARRIVAGRGGEFYYTDDHYNTFRLIKE